MVKTKKIMDGGKFMIASHNGMHEPHTGAAALALRAELYRTYLLENGQKMPRISYHKMLEALDLSSIDRSPAGKNHHSAGKSDLLPHPGGRKYCS